MSRSELQYSSHPRAVRGSGEELIGETRGRLTFIQGPCAKVEAQIRLRPDDLAPLHKLIRTELVGLGADPRQLGS